MARRPPLDLHGATVVVTGAGSGIGRATARAFAAAGSTVVCADIDEVTAKETAAALGGASVGRHLDVSDRAAFAAFAASVVEEHGVPHVVVNNAGVGMTGRFLDTTPEDWDWILGVNLHGVINGCQAFGPHLTAAGRGQVVNVSSGLGYIARGTEPAYCTTKAAVLHLSACLRGDWARHGVGVTAICPGVIDTPIIEHTRFLGERDTAKARARTKKTFSRGHSPDAVAAAIVKAVGRNSPVVPVGAETWLGWVGRRLLPARAGDLLARADLA
ncbi:MAG TPA: SDR family NAD(P)-dependent oxidoreductase [Aquihabitans sp.]|jgi:NAD(P)-dependent dehydrogenase (short-subunit alcohol dehydrogenase family)|nr:SDR family NAD(P)-dependent oxidoreductase [Aquihabitans sp.]